MEALHKVFFMPNAIKTPTRFWVFATKFWAQAIFCLLELCYMEALHKVFFMPNAIKPLPDLVQTLPDLVQTFPDFGLKRSFTYWSYAIWKLYIKFFERGYACVRVPKN